MTYPLEQTNLFQKLVPEVENVMQSVSEEQGIVFPENAVMDITQRICEERDEDALDFWMFLSDVEALDDNDDWSDANGCIEALILKWHNEKTAVAQPA